MDFLFGFRGRIGRLQWWGLHLAIFALLVVGIVLVDMRSGWGVRRPVEHIFSSRDPVLIFGAVLFWILASWVTIAATVKRYHDRDKAGWWWFVYFIPLVGPLWQWIECGFLSGTPGANRFGQRGGTSPEALGAEIDRMREAARSRDSVRTVEALPTAPQPSPVARAEPVRTGPPTFGRRGR